MLANLSYIKKSESLRISNEEFVFQNGLYFYDQHSNHLSQMFKSKLKMENLKIHTEHSIDIYCENLRVILYFL